MVFHRPSGKTHLVNSAAVRLLTDLLRTPRDLNQIISALVAQGAQDSPEEAEEILQLVYRLEDLGLVYAT